MMMQLVPVVSAMVSHRIGWLRLRVHCSTQPGHGVAQQICNRPRGSRVIVRTGRGSGMIMTRKVHLLRLPQSSRAVQVTTLVPAGKQLPEGGTQNTATFGSQ